VKFLPNALVILAMSSPALAVPETVFEQKQALIDRLVSSQPADMSANVQHVRADVQALRAKAQRFFDQGDRALALEVQQQAFRRAVELRSLLVGGKRREGHSLVKYQAFLAVCQDYIDLLKSELQSSPETDALETELKSLGQFATQDQWQTHWASVEIIHDKLALDVSRILDKQERTVELHLDTPEAQFAYELKIYDGMQLLLQGSQDGLKPEAIEQIKRDLTNAEQIRLQAQQLFENKRAPQAIEAMENANIVLKRAMRILGINLP
jgi:tetratricopeptide (TPR) repeat protein